LGTLEIGKLADLIVVDGNPLEDLNAMNSVLYIVRDGELVFSPQQESK
jgi:imidazolonepropionase-like amidohydrolase